MKRVLLLGLLICACQEPAAPDPLGARLAAWVPDSAAVLSYINTTGSGFRTPCIIRDSTTWRSVWEQAVSGHLPRPPLPGVTFDSNSVIMVVMNGGAASSVRLDSVVTFQAGSRAYVTRQWGFSSLQIAGDPAQFVRAPLLGPLSWQVRTID